MSNHLNEERLNRFRAVVNAMSGSCSIIISQVDPDALGGAVALAEVITKCKTGNGLKIKIFYGGAVSHPQNVAIMNKFDLARRMRPIRQFGEDDNRNVVLVDSSSLDDARLQLKEKIDPVIVIDHHRGSSVQEREGTFVWIEDVGSASTLVVELMRSLKIGPLEEHPMVALLLAVGIYTDTSGLTDCIRRDRDAYNVVADIAPGQELTQLFRYPLPSSHFDNLGKALENREFRDGKMVTHLGKIRPEEGDDLSTIADSLIRMTGVTLVIVWGIVDKTVRISARNADITNPLDVFLRDRFAGASCGAKLSSDGRGIGGGTVSLDLGVWMTEGTTQEVVALVSKWINNSVFQK